MYRRYLACAFLGRGVADVGRARSPLSGAGTRTLPIITQSADTPPREILDEPEAGGRAIRGGAIRSVTYVVGILLTGLAVPLMTNHLGLVNFGRFVTATTVVMIVAGVTEFGLSGVGTREYVVAAHPDRRALLSSLLGLRTVLTVIGLLVAAVLMVIARYPGVVVTGMLVSGLGLVLLNTEQTYAIALNAELRWGISSFIDTINSSVTGLATLVLVLIGGELFSFFWVSVVSSLAALVVAIYFLRGRVTLRPSFDARHWGSMLRDSLPYAAGVTIGVFYPRVGLLAVSLGSGPRQVGYYSTAFKVVEVLGGVSGLLAGTAFPIFARAGRDDHARLHYATSKVTDTALIVGTYLAISVFVAAPFIVHVLGPPSFAPTVPVLRIQAAVLLAGFIATTWSATLLSLRLHTAVLRSTAVGLVVALVLCAALIPPLGARGASIASVAAEFVVAGAYLRELVRAHAHLRPSFAIVPRLAAAAAVALIPSLVLSLPSVALWGISSAIFVVLAWQLRIVPHEILHAFRDGVRNRRPRKPPSNA
jgi:O-antigen/teichoic acid export membrane protein